LRGRRGGISSNSKRAQAIWVVDTHESGSSRDKIILNHTRQDHFEFDQRHRRGGKSCARLRLDLLKGAGAAGDKESTRSGCNDERGRS